MAKRASAIDVVCYTDGKRAFFVDQGIALSNPGGVFYGTFALKAGGTLRQIKRIKRRALPMRPNRDLAQQDLDAWAEYKGYARHSVG